MTSRITCTLGVGCDETGICYAMAHGQPDKCGVNIVDDPTPIETPVPVGTIEHAFRAGFHAGNGVDAGCQPDMWLADFVPQLATSNDLWVSLERVLRDKGADDAWIEYALPDLKVAAQDYAAGQWARGHASGAAGDPLPNPQPATAEEPNAETQDAIAEVRAGGLERFDTVEAAMTSLNAGSLDDGVPNQFDQDKRGFDPS